MTKEEFMAHCEVIADLAAKKHSDYQGNIFDLDDYFPLGDLSYAQMIWVKTVRIMSLVEQKAFSGKEPKFELLRDSTNDLIAYAVFYLGYLKTLEKK